MKAIRLEFFKTFKFFVGFQNLRSVKLAIFALVHWFLFFSWSIFYWSMFFHKPSLNITANHHATNCELQQGAMQKINGGNKSDCNNHENNKNKPENSNKKQTRYDSSGNKFCCSLCFFFCCHQENINTSRLMSWHESNSQKKNGKYVKPDKYKEVTLNCW